MPFWETVQLEIIKTLLVCLTLGLGWVIGQRIIAYWDMRKKRQELDIAIATQFHKLYGEFKEVSRLWRAIRFTGKHSKQLTFPKTIPQELLKRAAAAEGGVEAIILKLTTERVLEKEDNKTLGLFRQAYQELRHAIRDGKSLDWTYGTPEYDLFNKLASKAACIISSDKTKKRSELVGTHKVLRKITKVRSKDWKDALGRPGPLPGAKNLPGQYFRAGVGAVVVNMSGVILALERTDVPGAWQLPQGGIESSEEPLQAALREVAEETGISETNLELLDEYPEPLVYDLPMSAWSEKTGRGQVQYWFLFRFHGIDTIIDLKSSGEFRAWKWVSFDSLLTSVADFRKPIYQRLTEQFRGHISVLRPADSNTNISSGAA